MHRHTTLRIGGPADIWVAPRSVDCLQRVVGLCHQHGVPLCVLGSGSNLAYGGGPHEWIDIDDQTMPEPGVVPLADSVRTPPGIPEGASSVPWEIGVVSNRPLTSRKAFSGSPEAQ